MNRQDAKSAKIFQEVDEELDELARRVIGAAIEVHRVLGAGFLESVYEEALCLELSSHGIGYLRQPIISVEYKGHHVGEGRLDILVENQLVVELKAVEKLAPIHTAQVLSYLKTTGYKLALLINFNVPMLKEGLKRVALNKPF